MAGSYTNILMHLVFSTKNRTPWITPELKPRLFQYIGGTVRKLKASLLEIGGPADHLHLLVRMHQDKATADLLRDLKSASSGWVHDTFPALKDFAWQDGYGAFSVSHSQSLRVREYIASQETHHRRRDFQTEFLAFLKAHEIEYDERYIWR